MSSKNLRLTILPTSSSCCCPVTLVLLGLLCFFGMIEECLGFTSPPIRYTATNNLIGIRQNQQEQHRRQQQQQGRYETRCYIFGLDKVVEKTTTFGRAPATQEEPMSYVIERIGDENRGNERIFREVAEVCIDVFFKEQLDAKPEDRIPPWKEAQISYLKALQTGDLKLRRNKYQGCNEMFLAYEVIPATGSDSWGSKPLIVEPEKIYNMPRDSNINDDFVRGRLLGFCEITQRPYGLGKGYGLDNPSSGGRSSQGDDFYYSEEDETNDSGKNRPVLTNLAVSADVRKYGIGSKLVDACERKAAAEWKMNEIVLEVEDYNDTALKFYRKRGYTIVFNDPASRRYDVGGIMLKKVRCTRQILRKSLSQRRAQLASQEVASMPFNKFFQQFRQTMSSS